MEIIFTVFEKSNVVMASNDEIEKMIQEKGLTNPRVTPTDVDNAVDSVTYYNFPGTTITICLITMQNGYHVTGESGCADPKNFNKEVGEKIAFDQAKAKIWPLLGYKLRDDLYNIYLKSLKIE